LTIAHISSTATKIPPKKYKLNSGLSTLVAKSILSYYSTKYPAKNSNINTLGIALAIETNSYMNILKVSFVDQISNLNPEFSNIIDNESLNKMDNVKNNSGTYLHFTNPNSILKNKREKLSKIVDLS